MEHLCQQSAAVFQYTGYPYHHFIQQQQEEQMQVFWNNQLEEIKKLRDFKHHQFPIARMKRIMKSNPNVIRISAEAPILLVKACELFIGELTLCSWLYAHGNNRQLLQKNDFGDAVRQTKIFDFLVNIVPSNEINEGATGFGPGMVGSTVSGVPNYYPPMGQPAMPRVITGNTAIPAVAPSVYVQPWLQEQAVENNPYATGGNSGQGNFDPQGFDAKMEPKHILHFSYQCNGYICAWDMLSITVTYYPEKQLISNVFIGVAMYIIIIGHADAY